MSLVFSILSLFSQDRCFKGRMYSAYELSLPNPYLLPTLAFNIDGKLKDAHYTNQFPL